MSTSTSPSPSPSPDSDGDAGQQQQQQQQRSRHRNGHRYHHHHRESPTALHAVLGVALFLFGNIIAQDPSLALSREPTTPAPYWLAALDVFDAGENLPCQTSGGNNHHNNADGADDDDSEKVNNNWRVAIVWGRTLVSLAYNATKQQHTRSSPSPSSSPLSATGMTTTARRRSSPSSRVPPSPPPRYSPRSPLAAITALRTAGLAHHGRAAASAPELLTLAADQFSRGIFHMPHTTRMHTPDDTTRCPRAHVLFTLASDVLAVAERLDDAELSRRWAAWADAVFQQMHMEGVDVADDAWRVRVAVARGRCWLVVGSARVEELEDALEREDLRVLMSKKAEDARAGFTMAISFFDRAKASASTESSERWLVDMQPWLSEALLSLANLTTDEDAREALYARTQTEGGEGVKRELGPTPMRRSRSMIAMDVRMDES
ncbi:hypothetical protein BJV74DRAFT_844344 [Russula compacta]|nr:hypothetical protein BJV74DRAFT_844344 [Russula compacta]